MARPNAAFSLLHVSLVAANHMDVDCVGRLIWPMTGVEPMLLPISPVGVALCLKREYEISGAL